MNNVQPNSWRAWWLAARPKTLSGALVPVATAAALAYHTSPLLRHAWLAGAFCALFAGGMQVASNFINDLIDFERGTDRADRLGPERACQQGWISPRAMRWGIVVVLTLAGIVGLGLLAVVWEQTPLPKPQLAMALLGIGVACMAGAFLYTTLFSRLGLGDVMVLLFFGLVPVCGTFFALTGTLSWATLWLGLSIGCVVDTLLAVNNFRDRDTDRAVGKRTLVVVLGECGGRGLYLAVGCCGAFLMAVADASLHQRLSVLTLCMLPYLFFHFLTWRKMCRIGRGRELNLILGETSRNMLLFALLTLLGLWGSA
ncbi:1,4-dihydroxy-2-naphthoate octaprenyltransferase [Alloprevotella sp. Lung230]|uniref:1,4-dihydroxy-2-naphthoate octaprenyltransferase n=1 Tax=Alloprevotella sp. Lung230 TaxID=2766595 RepID=UPI001654D717|nr:1,4-dihydroxy-2-naphthoate octaprenyltransferase [Alloprevotella sp. Lung230]MBC8625971.1 1,4-dihydroxy-2-naphthoate octaprenyltransferase [Alloprevotella sp. Lung230]